MYSYFTGSAIFAPSLSQFSCRHITFASLLLASLSQACPNKPDKVVLISSRP